MEYVEVLEAAVERAEQAIERAEQATVRAEQVAEQERKDKERLIEQLKKAGIEPVVS